MSRRTSGSGSIRKRATGTWEARYYGADRQQHSKTFTKKALAQRWLNDQINSVNAGEWHDPSRALEPFDTFVDAWLAAKAIKCKRRTVVGYRQIADKHLRPPLGRTPVGQITPMTCDRFVADLVADGAEAGTVGNVFACLKAALKEAVRARAIQANPAEGTELPKVRKREMLFLAPEEVQAVEEEMPEHLRTIVLFAAFTGLRFGEVTALTVGHVDTMRRTVRVAQTGTWVKGDPVVTSPKTEAGRRTVVMPTFLNDLVVARLAGRATNREAYVFPGLTGDLLRHSAFYQPHFRPAVARALPEHRHALRFHDLRHTCVAMLIRSGAHPKAIANRMGHSSINITMDRYGHLYPDEDQRLADSLDSAFVTANVTSPDQPSVIKFGR